MGRGQPGTMLASDPRFWFRKALVAGSRAGSEPFANFVHRGRDCGKFAVWRNGASTYAGPVPSS